MNFNEIQELLKKTREEKNISLEELSKKLKVTKHKLYELENNTDFLEENKTYGYFLLKNVCKEIGLPTDKLEKRPEITEKPTTVAENRDDEKEGFMGIFKEKVINIFKLSFLFLLIFSSFYLIKITKKSLPENTDINIENYSYDFTIKNTIPTEKESSNSSLNTNQNIFIVAKNNAWLSANVDGTDRVINLSTNKKVKLNFKKKIHFITIGNADNIVIYYKNKKVVFNKKKIIHNIFVDKDGIFQNGYNLIGKNT